MPDAPQRILIVRLTAIGDAIYSLPVASALRAHFPKAHIAWVVEGAGVQIIQGHTALDQVIALPRHWVRSPRQVVVARRLLRAQPFDVTIDVQGLNKSAFAAWLSGAPLRIGYGGESGREFSRRLNNELVTPTKVHVVDRGLELLTALGIRDPEVVFGIPHDPVAEATVAAALGHADLTNPVVINPGAGWPSRLWPTACFAQVAVHLHTVHGRQTLVVWAGESERRMAQEVVDASEGTAILAPPTNLRELTALLRHARLMVSSDTGPLHLAAAMDIPCVGLSGPMNAERNGPYGRQTIAIQKLRLEGKARTNRRTDTGPILAITVQDVLAACDRLLTAPAASPIPRPPEVVGLPEISRLPGAAGTG